ncbi:hypothetical protein [Sporomusa sp. KB1]|uniref:hypothetical protein n=1 Tax=Sporomusa sp. KB1 TaxID=943346 RepID=UPI0011A11BDF|nr:hypothetical protein [Sporomusa sp. KB1]TWH52014.1 hypothetical protein Salpa_0519 [Sporomusa sp. KB1]
MKIRKYPQRILSSMTRFKDAIGRFYRDGNKQCYLVRNNTKIYFGEAEKLLGTVIMTNPGSYGLDEIPGWSRFKSGYGEVEAIEGFGYADQTMQNIIWAIKDAFKLMNMCVPSGYIRVHNLSSVVCPNRESAEDYHQYVRQIINRNKADDNLLEEFATKNFAEFIKICNNSPFVILGFVKNIFSDKANDLLNWSSSCSNVLISSDNSGWPSHPRRWRTEIALHNKAIAEIVKVISKADFYK